MATAADPATMPAAARAHMRLLDLAKTDPEIAALIPDEAAFKAIGEPGTSYYEVISRSLAAYAPRQALGMRAYELRNDEASGRKVRHYLPRFDMITYSDVARSLEAIANAWRHHPVHGLKQGEMVALIAFASTQMALADLACAYAQTIAIPLQANLPAPDMEGILSTTAPAAIVVNIENLAIATGYAIGQESVRSLIVIDSDSEVDDERESIAAARKALEADGGRVALTTLDDLIKFGGQYPWEPLPPHPEGGDALVLLMHTSGSTGTPKGAMIHDSMCANLWSGLPLARPSLHLVCAPMNHFMGRSMVYGALAQGGKACFTLKSDMSALFEDARIVRPTTLLLFPRIAEILYQTYQADLQRRLATGMDPAAADAEVRAAMKAEFLGDRICSAGVGSAPTAPEVREFLCECFNMAMTNGYSSTEAGTGAITVDGRIQRHSVIDYKLLDVPELGYYGTDKPYPRGELLLKSRFAIKGYYKRPDATAEIFDDEGWLHTGDVVEERGPDEVTWIGRRNNVIKLSQAEYVALGPLEATYLGSSALISQIFIYGNSLRSFLLAVVVPDLAVAASMAGHEPDRDELRTMVLAELQEVARAAELKSFEVPRDVLIELEPFSHENGLLSSVRKPLHPKLKERYQGDLEALYQTMDRKQQEELAQLRADDTGLTTKERVAGALKANLGLAAIDPESAESYGVLGGDSLGAVSLSLLMEDVFGVTVPVSVLLDPSGNVTRIARFIDNAKARAGAGGTLADFALVHGAGAATLRAADLTLDAFLDSEALEAAGNAAAPAGRPRTVLMTGATGFLGRFLCLEWMEGLAVSGGKLICLVRAGSEAAGRARLAEAFDSGDAGPSTRFEQLAGQCLEVLPGDLATPRLGLDDAAFARLAEEVDQIVHPGALVNHLLSYQNLFEPNV
ncbi:MAG: AMP-binding protein, partial [Novosphingobium sp.]